MRLLFSVSFVLLLVGFALATPLAAQIQTWNGSSGNNFFTPDNWSAWAGDGTDIACVNEPIGNYPPIISGDGTFNGLEVGDNCSGNVNAGSLVMTGGNVSLISNSSYGSHVFIGDGSSNPGSTGTSSFTMTGGTITKDQSCCSIDVGTNGGDGKLDMSGNSTIINGDGFYVGTNDGSQGTVNMQDYSRIQTVEATFGSGATSTVTLNYHAAMTVGINLNVGTYDDNTSSQLVLNGNSVLTVGGRTEINGKLTPTDAMITLNDSAQMNAQEVWVGHLYNSGDVSGAGSLVLNGSSQLTCTRLHIGDEGGTGVVTLNGNAHATINGNVEMGFEWGSTALLVGPGSTVTVAGSGALLTVNGSLSVGSNGGIGVFNQNAGRTTVPNQAVVLGETDYWDAGGVAGGQTTGNGMLNLNGGVFETLGITTNASTQGRAAGNTTGLAVGTVNFNGGTLRALGNSTNFITVDNPAQATMTLNVQAGGAVIDTQAYNVKITQPLLNGGAGGGLTKLGSGTLTLSGANNYAGMTAVAAGTLQLLGTSIAAPGAWNPVLNLGGADVQAGKLVFDYTGGTDPVATIKTMLSASYDGGRWDRGEFRCSTAAEDGLTLGWIDNPATHQVTVMATIPGDFNLDGVVDNQDRAIWFAGAWSGATWAQGDANYDGHVDGLDRDILLASNLRSISSGFAAVAVPEPATVSLLAAGLIGLLCICRKSGPGVRATRRA